LKSIISIVRSVVEPYDNDRVLYKDIQLAKEIMEFTELDMDIMN
jgi:histidine ammonia-lyase